MQEGHEILAWQGLIAGLIGVIVGGAIGIVSNYLAYRWQVAREKKNIAGAFGGEVAAILETVKARGYVGMSAT